MLLVELMGGASLADHLARRRPGFNLGCAAARRWARDLLRALAHLHDRDPILMHRDVKPENLLLTAGRPAALKLADFGLAKMVRTESPLPLYPTQSIPYEGRGGRGLLLGEKSSGSVEGGGRFPDTAQGQVRREERDGTLHRGHTGTLRWMAPEVLGEVSAYTEKVRQGCAPRAFREDVQDVAQVRGGASPVRARKRRAHAFVGVRGRDGKHEEGKQQLKRRRSGERLQVRRLLQEGEGSSLQSTIPLCSTLPRRCACNPPGGGRRQPAHRDWHWRIARLARSRTSSAREPPWSGLLACLGRIHRALLEEYILATL